MTWSQAVAYKGIFITLPLNARPGKPWRLLLSASPSIQRMSISVGNVRLTEKAPFPVVSMPVEITPKPEKGRAKQTQIEPMCGPSPAGLLASAIRVSYFTIKPRPTWTKSSEPSAIRNGITCGCPGKGHAFAKPLRSNGMHKARDVFPGTGTRIVFIVPSALEAARLGETSHEGQFLAIDLDTPQLLVLDWDGESLPEQVAKAGGFDLTGRFFLHVANKRSVLCASEHPPSPRMADVTYNTPSLPFLPQTLSSLVQLLPNIRAHPPVLILGYKERDPTERSL
ncbi:hypothetical protein BDM02DRAFT_3263230 [Thelephora ganbajun]|uniref:Uncharacterized protein n=1 Tax=Thelephora ganbajun TaxID=370292 RepID=A0ACB6Z667_THEGA|nr:hypothetical protein BDM02DRAFT_3263230 [Thelephora ganbajun]